MISLLHQSLPRRSLLKSSVAGVALVLTDSGISLAASLRDPFIENLIRRMTLEEKAGQLTLTSGYIGPVGVNPGDNVKAFRQDMEANVRTGRVTGYFNNFSVETARALQHIAVKESRLGIPLIFAADVVHGMRTGYPIPLGEASSFDPDLCARTARAMATEASGFGLHWLFAPMVDVARDQRWGRVSEGAGEDPWLGSRIGAARVRGMQGDDLKAQGSVLACPKHFAGYGAVEGGLEYNTADISQTTLRQVHLPPFQAAFGAGALATMSSFNDIDGVPATGNRHLLTDILRGEWHFPGLVVSDYESEKEMIAHGFAEDEADAVLKALTAGCDVAMQSGLYLKHVPDLVRSRRLPLSVVDEAVRRVLRVKHAIGLFEAPFRSLDPARTATVERTSAMVDLARESARKSIVLLKNDGDILPLPTQGKHIAFIGPYVSDRANLMGPWMLQPDLAKAVTLEQGVRDALGASVAISFTQGCAPLAAVEGGIVAAVAAARAADVVVLYVGETARMSGEAQSRAQIILPPPQQALVEAVAKVGKPMVILLQHGRALALEGAVRDAAAIVCTWFLGSESGHAIADILFGAHGPQGRLPVSFPHNSGQEPYYYNHRSTGRPQKSDKDLFFKSRYVEFPNRALYPFGHGLGFAPVRYGAVSAQADTFRRGDTVRLQADVTNIGKVPVHEVAQLYIHDRAASVTQPVRVLKGMRHLDLAPGQSATVDFVLDANELAFVHADNSTSVDAGIFDIWIAPSAEAGVPVSIRLLDRDPI